MIRSNTKFITILILFLLAPIKNVKSLTKEWIPNINYENPQHWEKEKLPCPQDNIIFPVDFDAALKLPVVINVNQLILPNDGYLLMESNSKIAFNNIKNMESRCNGHSKEDMRFKQPKVDFWYLSKNWKIVDEDKSNMVNNPAVSHEELIPCDGDIVVFPPQNSFLIDLEDAEHVLFYDIFMDNKSHIMDFVSFSNTNLGLTMLKNSEKTYVQQSRYHNRCSQRGNLDECSCHGNIRKFKMHDTLCANEKPFCKPTHCLNPIKPEGHCCLICGAYMTLDGKSLQPLKNIVDKIKASKSSYANNLYTHISSIYDIYDDYHNIQIVAVDKNYYDEISTDFMKEVNKSLIRDYEGNLVK